MYLDYYIFKHAEHENESFKSITQKTKKLSSLFYFLSFFKLIEFTESHDLCSLQYFTKTQDSLPL